MPRARALAPIAAVAVAVVVSMSSGVEVGPARAVSAGPDARQAQLPAGLSHVPTIRRIYPELWRLEQRRKDGVRWERLRRGARAAWMRSHPCATATLANRYATGAWSSWETMVATWRCDGVAGAHVSFMRCIPEHEGGYDRPDRWNGFAVGWPPPPGRERNIVLGHLQLRPAWYRGAMEGRPGTYAGDYWTRDLFEWAVHPVNQARATAPIGPDQYATEAYC